MEKTDESLEVDKVDGNDKDLKAQVLIHRSPEWEWSLAGFSPQAFMSTPTRLFSGGLYGHGSAWPPKGLMNYQT